MDTFTMTSNARNYPFIFNRGRWWERKIFDRVGLIGNLAQYSNHFSSNFYHPWKEKMEVMGIPIDFSRVATKYKDSNAIQMLYTGGCSFEDRDPRYFVGLFERLSKEMPVVLSFYGKNNVAEYLDNLNMKNSQIRNQGFVSFLELNKARARANFMVNFGSKNEIIVPSRLLEHISTGKPIIHVFYRNDDPCLDILRNYPLVLLIDATAPYDRSYVELCKFVKSYNGTVVEQDTLEKIYKCYSQGYLAKICDTYFCKYYECKD